MRPLALPRRGGPVAAAVGPTPAFYTYRSDPLVRRRGIQRQLPVVQPLRRGELPGLEGGSYPG